MSFKLFLVIIVVMVPLLIFQQNCSKVNFIKQEESSVGELSAPPADVPVTSDTVITPPALVPKNCSSPDGTLAAIENGKGRIYFETQEDGLYCDKTQFRICIDGTLSGRFSKTSCSISYRSGSVSPKSCPTPVGENISHGASVILFSESTGDCTAQIRSCNDGILSGQAAYNQAHCRLTRLEGGGPSCSLSWNGSTLSLPNNSRLIGFMAELTDPTNDKNCELATVRCNAGNLVGTTPNLVSSCRKKIIEELPDGSLLTGHAFNELTTSIGYKISAQTSGQNCSLEYQKNGAWIPISLPTPNSFNCGGAAGTVIKTSLSLNALPDFHWSSAETSGKYILKIRLTTSSSNTEAINPLICLNRGVADIPGATPQLDEDCDGNF